MSIFAFIDGIQGQVSDPSFRNWIDIARIKWNVKRQITSASATQNDRESSNAVMGDLTITRFMDKATPKLFIESCCGTGKEIKIVTTKTGAGNGADPYMEYVLGHAVISSYHVLALGNNAVRPHETLTISFTSLQSKYIPYDENGISQAPIAVGFDTATNSKI